MFLVVAFGASGCAKVPYTNRSQLVIVPAQDEIRLGERAFSEVVAESQLESRASVRAPVEDVGRRIALAAERPDYDWRFVVIDDGKQANAFALPGGKVAVYTGILPIAQTNHGLAVVLGHEVAHAIARHGAERMSQALVAQAGGSVLAGFLGGGAAADMIMAAYGLGSEYGILMPWGRGQESEADHIGLLLMAKAGYDPREALPFWRRMAEQGKGRSVPEFLSTHPAYERRAAQIAQWLPEALRRFDESVAVERVTLVEHAR